MKYSIPEMLGEEYFLGIYPYFKADDVPALLKEGQLPIDVQNRNSSVQAYAETTFQKHKKQIVDF